MTELLTIEELSDPIIEEEEIRPAKKGFLGIGKQEAVVHRKVTRREGHKYSRYSSQRKEVNQYKGENAFSLKYIAYDRSDEHVYKDYSNRGGNMMGLELTLPESIARKVFEKSKNNPDFIRSIVKEKMRKLLKEQKGITDEKFEEIWDRGDEYTHHPVKPPYERWASAGKRIQIEEI